MAEHQVITYGVIHSHNSYTRDFVSHQPVRPERAKRVLHGFFQYRSRARSTAALGGEPGTFKKGAHMTETNETPCLRIVRRFGVPPDVVFSAFTNPESMQIWWDENTTFDINLSVGGRWTIIRREGETTYTATGEYLEIEYIGT